MYGRMRSDSTPSLQGQDMPGCSCDYKEYGSVTPCSCDLGSGMACESNPPCPHSNPRFSFGCIWPCKTTKAVIVSRHRCPTAALIGVLSRVCGHAPQKKCSLVPSQKHVWKFRLVTSVSFLGIAEYVLVWNIIRTLISMSLATSNSH